MKTTNFDNPNTLQEKLFINLKELEKVENNFTKTDIETDISKDFMKKCLKSDMSIITHSGGFHPDEIYSIALIYIARIAIKNIMNHLKGDQYEYHKFCESDLHNVTRINFNYTNDDEGKNMYKNNLILDVLNGHFDHHHLDQNNVSMSNFKSIEPGVENPSNKMATFGSLWSAIGHIFDIPYQHDNHFNVYDLVYNKFIKRIDKRDLNGYTIESPMSDIISDVGIYMNESDFDFIMYDNYPETDIEYLKFKEAIMLAYKILKSVIYRAQGTMKSIIEVTGCNKCVYGKTPDGIAYLKILKNDKAPFIPLDICKYLSFEDKPIELVINENPVKRDNSYRILCVNSNILRFSENLIENPASGQTFVHPQGFMIAFESLEKLYDFLDNSYVYTYQHSDIKYIDDIPEKCLAC
jgi:uncharacterized UPF0160 family protein